MIEILTSLYQMRTHDVDLSRHLELQANHHHTVSLHSNFVKRQDSTIVSTITCSIIYNLVNSLPIQRHPLTHPSPEQNGHRFQMHFLEMQTFSWFEFQQNVFLRIQLISQHQLSMAWHWTGNKLFVYIDLSPYGVHQATRGLMMDTELGQHWLR